MVSLITSDPLEYKNAREINVVHWLLSKEQMSHKKIQKMAYYLQAWSVTLNDVDFIPGFEFEGWVHGPVNMNIWHICKDFGWRDIMINKESEDSIMAEMEQVWGKDQIEIMELVWNTYGNYTANELEALTHSEVPWINSRLGKTDFERSRNKIKREDMKNYYINFFEQ
ncbi:Panacea domain-containing protein [Erysipelothrix anatis]|uniref:Panacea domain-containing protein n=1 Tax=Erysipelothrix anatis TaxID=2683713 RepID=UPI001358CF41|nr:type II toxin-antitoxin system antitoxin SocA domain-containing protein [Erysipelothrix anatis]